METFRSIYPQFSNFFSFPQFNQIQLECFQKIRSNDQNMIISAPTSSGKTVIFELFMLKYLKDNSLKTLYLAPIKALCHEKYGSWVKKFNKKIKIIQLHGDSNQVESSNLMNMDLVISTPEKIDICSREDLSYLKSLKLLMIDEIHMLNFEQRGATLEAIVSRIRTINKHIRIVAVSATIPNISQVAEWLNVPKKMVCHFGTEYRPTKLNKIVLGFNNTKNPFTFQKVLNYQLLTVIRKYSEGGGTLVFCQTKKGTQQACQQIMNKIYQRELISNQEHLRCLVEKSKLLSNNNLKTLITSGVGFHNGGLTLQDRKIIEELFLEQKIRILCTTSTLAMGVNLPARLVVIKSTKCYRGPGKGYEEYTQMEIDQMMGRAGRPPFDTEGTAVIMTEKQNYEKYKKMGQLEYLESRFYQNLVEHLNCEISLRSISCMSDVYTYFYNSFCAIRMKNSPRAYGIKADYNKFVEEQCQKCIDILEKYSFIIFVSHSRAIITKELSHVVSRNGIKIKTITNLVDNLQNMKDKESYLTQLSFTEDFERYKSKMEERKILKSINDSNKYPLKESICNSQRKAYVLIQAILSGTIIENWELRKQAQEMISLFKKINYCLKVALKEKILFQQTKLCLQFQRYFQLQFWECNQKRMITQVKNFKESEKMLHQRGFNTFSKVKTNLDILDSIPNSNAKKVLRDSFFSLETTIRMNIREEEGERFMTIKYMNTNYPALTILVGNEEKVYSIRWMSEKEREITIYWGGRALEQTYHIYIKKNKFIGFDENYILDPNGKLTIKENENSKKAGNKARKSLSNSLQNYEKREQTNRKSTQEKTIKHHKKGEIPHSIQFNQKLKGQQSQFFSSSKGENRSFRFYQPDIITSHKKESEHKSKSPQSRNFSKDSSELLPSGERTLFHYNWRPGVFHDSRQIEFKPELQKSRVLPQTIHRPTLKLTDRDSKRTPVHRENRIEEQNIQMLSTFKKQNKSAYEYFMNMFQ